MAEPTSQISAPVFRYVSLRFFPLGVEHQLLISVTTENTFAAISVESILSLLLDLYKLCTSPIHKNERFFSAVNILIFFIVVKSNVRLRLGRKEESVNAKLLPKPENLV